MSDEIWLIDTNILVYAYDRSEGEKHELCKRLVNKCWKLWDNYSISTQSLSEFLCCYHRDPNCVNLPGNR